MRRGSSSLLLFTIFAEIAQLVEHDLAKVGVAGSSPVFRSPYFFLFFFRKTTFQMNLYLRYFDREILVHNVDDAIDFLASIDEIGMNPMLEEDIREYAASDVYYPKRYKIRPRVYFIIIKTEAATMLDFKEKRAVHSMPSSGEREKILSPVIAHLTEEQMGWYEGVIDFKRVLQVPGTGKYQYRDTHFVAQCKAVSGLDCYNRIVDHLRQRVDSRSQFPSAKGKNFKFRYLGQCK